MKRLILSSALLLFAASAYAGDAGTAITARVQQFADAANRDDTAALLAMYGEGFSAVPNGGAEITDRAELEQLLGSWLTTSSDVRLETLALDEWGEYVYELGRVYYLQATEAGESVPTEESYLIIWKQAGDGNWYIQVDAWWDSTE